MDTTLGALWNDVLHFTAIPPQDLKRALLDAGMKSFEASYYKIDPLLLDPEQTTTYLYRHKDTGPKMSTINFADYDPANLEPYTKIPNATKEYYKEIIA